MRLRPIICVLLLLVSPITALRMASAQAQDTSALINEALDKPVGKLELNGTLPQVIATIGEQTGVRLEASAAVWDLLPWGQGTNINAKIENQTLRQALEAITRKLGLTFVLRDNAVELRPVPALMRLGKRATVQELAAIDQLYSTPLALGSDRAEVHKLLETVDAKLAEGKSGLAIENRTGDTLKADQVLSIPRNATLADALEVLSNATTATWYPWGKSILVVTKEDQVRNQLGKTISMRYNGTDISQVLMELSQKAGLDFDIQPGAIQAVPAEFRNVRLMLDNATIKQALDTISGFTGLGYTVNAKGIYLWSSASTGASGGRDPGVALIPFNNGMQLILPQSQVPPDVQEYLKLKRQQEIQRIRSLMKQEGFKPTSQPVATQPVNQDL